MFACALTDSHWGETGDSGHTMHWGQQTVGQCVCYKYELLAYTSVSARRFNEIKADTRQTSSLMQSSKFPRAPNPLPSLLGTGTGTGTGTGDRDPSASFAGLHISFADNFSTDE